MHGRVSNVTFDIWITRTVKQKTKPAPKVAAGSRGSRLQRLRRMARLRRRASTAGAGGSLIPFETLRIGLEKATATLSLVLEQATLVLRIPEWMPQ